jgi:DME family drug/metabolite transporter
LTEVGGYRFSGKSLLFPKLSPRGKHMIGVALALLSASFSGASVILVGKNAGKSDAFNISLAISLVGLAILWPVAWVTMNIPVQPAAVVLFGVCGLLSPGLVRLLYYKGLDLLGTSVNAALTSVYPLYTSLLAPFLLNETLSTLNWVGVALVVAGVVFVEVNACRSNFKHNHARNLVYPVLGGLTLGLANALRKYALNLFAMPALGVAVSYTFALAPYLLALGFSGSLRAKFSLKRETVLFWKAGVGQAAAWITAFYALSYEKVAVVTPLVSTEPLFVVLLSRVFLQDVEHVSGKLAASITLTVLGVALVLMR